MGAENRQKINYRHFFKKEKINRKFQFAVVRLSLSGVCQSNKTINVIEHLIYVRKHIFLT